MADIHQAIEWLKQGYKVRNKKWEPHTYCWFTDYDMSILCVQGPNNYFEYMVFHIDDFYGEWEIYDG